MHSAFQSNKNTFKNLRLWFGPDFEVEINARSEAGVWSLLCCWCFVEVMKLNPDRDSEARFGQYFEF